MLAARKINDEFNIFEGMLGNAMFVGVWITIVLGQCCIVQFGGKIMKVHKEGLTQTQWIICLVIGFTALIWNAVLKLCSEKCCPVFGDEKAEDVAAAEFSAQLEQPFTVAY